MYVYVYMYSLLYMQYMHVYSNRCIQVKSIYSQILEPQLVSNHSI